MPLDAPWGMPRAEEYDQITADDWFLSQTKNSAILIYLRSGDNYETLYGFENAAQAWTVKETMHQVAVRVAEELEKVIVLNAPVRSISQDSTGVLVTSDAGNWRCEYAIVAVPIPLSVRIAYKPELPLQRDILAQHMPMGSVIKYWVGYETPFWRKRGLNGILQSDQPPSEFISGDLTPSEGRPGLLAGFMDAHNSMAWTGRSTEERKKVVM